MTYVLALNLQKSQPINPLDNEKINYRSQSENRTYVCLSDTQRKNFLESQYEKVNPTAENQ